MIRYIGRQDLIRIRQAAGEPRSPAAMN